METGRRYWLLGVIEHRVGSTREHQKDPVMFTSRDPVMSSNRIHL